jgi:hypothetical protein
MGSVQLEWRRPGQGNRRPLTISDHDTGARKDDGAIDHMSDGVNCRGVSVRLAPRCGPAVTALQSGSAATYFSGASRKVSG